MLEKRNYRLYVKEENWKISNYCTDVFVLVEINGAWFKEPGIKRIQLDISPMKAVLQLEYLDWQYPESEDLRVSGNFLGFATSKEWESAEWAPALQLVRHGEALAKESGKTVVGTPIYTCKGRSYVHAAEVGPTDTQGTDAPQANA